MKPNKYNIHRCKILFYVYFRLTSSQLPNTVHTGVAIKYRNQIVKFVESTVVYMTKLTSKELLTYVNTEEAM